MKISGATLPLKSQHKKAAPALSSLQFLLVLIPALITTTPPVCATQKELLGGFCIYSLLLEKVYHSLRTYCVPPVYKVVWD